MNLFIFYFKTMDHHSSGNETDGSVGVSGGPITGHVSNDLEQRTPQ